MYQCSFCGTNYDLSKEINDEIGKVNEKNPVVSVVISCPGCSCKRVVGGEHDWDEFEDRPIIMMFGIEYNEKLHKDLPHFDAIEIKVTSQQIIDFIREEGLIELNDRVKIIEIVYEHFKPDVDGNDVNQILRNVFGV